MHLVFQQESRGGRRGGCSGGIAWRLRWRGWNRLWLLQIRIAITGTGRSRITHVIKEYIIRGWRSWPVIRCSVIEIQIETPLQVLAERIRCEATGTLLLVMNLTSLLVHHAGLLATTTSSWSTVSSSWERPIQRRRTGSSGQWRVEPRSTEMKISINIFVYIRWLCFIGSQ